MHSQVKTAAKIYGSRQHLDHIQLSHSNPTFPALMSTTVHEGKKLTTVQRDLHPTYDCTREGLAAAGGSAVLMKLTGIAEKAQKGRCWTYF